ncbi:MAG: hypothetical protein ABSF90_03660, partial [Syntrophobacteraceae bacterium]
MADPQREQKHKFAKTQILRFSISIPRSRLAETGNDWSGIHGPPRSLLSVEGCGCTLNLFRQNPLRKITVWCRNNQSETSGKPKDIISLIGT